jgi:hypothetical protein
MEEMIGKYPEAKEQLPRHFPAAPGIVCPTHTDGRRSGGTGRSKPLFLTLLGEIAKNGSLETCGFFLSSTKYDLLSQGSKELCGQGHQGFFKVIDLRPWILTAVIKHPYPAKNLTC